MSLVDDLGALSGKPLDGGGFVLTVKKTKQATRYVSGVPYPTTAFRERAFVFGSKEDALEIAKRHFPKHAPSVEHAKGGEA